MATTPTKDIGASILAGAFAGTVAGVVLAIVMTLANVANGVDPWIGAKAAGAPFLGARAMQPGFDGVALAAGVLTHLAVSAAWGAAFGLIFLGLPPAPTVAAGLAWGVIVWFVMYYVVLPIAGLGEMARATPISLALFNHEVFGLALALAFMPLERRVAPDALAPGIASRMSTRAHGDRRRA
jgi:hypothetical protein